MGLIIAYCLHHRLICRALHESRVHLGDRPEVGIVSSDGLYQLFF